MRYYLLLIVCFLYGCGVNTTVEKGTDLPNKSNISRYGLSEACMNYVIFKTSSSGQLVIINTTKDSLECEYYKQQLNKK